jgi:AmmeMemoRadiSam system protein B
MGIRSPAVAGYFYPSSQKRLLDEVRGFLEEGKEVKGVKGAVSPHAGYAYSGKVAGKLFSSIEAVESFVFAGPNHQGLGRASFAIFPEGIWKTPIGDVEVDEELSSRIMAETDMLEADEVAHSREHSIEVQLPFLLVRNPGAKIVPISVRDYSLSHCREVGMAIARAITSLGRKAVVVASSDMSHYEHYEEARRKDRLAIDAILALDEEELERRVRTHHITMCGLGPVIIAISCAKMLGAKKAELVSYMTSGDTTGDFSSVVGYAGVVMY